MPRDEGDYAYAELHAETAYYEGTRWRHRKTKRVAKLLCPIKKDSTSALYRYEKPVKPGSPVSTKQIKLGAFYKSFDLIKRR